jgi:hypothetical protein
MQRAHVAPRCTAKSKRTGKPCRAPAVRGWKVCRMHGARGGAQKASATEITGMVPARKRQSPFGGSSNHYDDQCLLSGVKRTCRFAAHMSACDPKRTLDLQQTVGPFVSVFETRRKQTQLPGPIIIDKLSKTANRHFCILQLKTIALDCFDQFVSTNSTWMLPSQYYQTCVGCRFLVMMKDKYVHQLSNSACGLSNRSPCLATVSARLREVPRGTRPRTSRCSAHGCRVRQHLKAGDQRGHTINLWGLAVTDIV